MADDTPENEEEKKGLPLMPIIAVAAVLLIEAVVIVGLFIMSGAPEETKAQPGVVDEVALGEKPAEALVISGKFQNTKSGRSFMYDTEVYVVVKQKHHEEILEKIESMQGSIQRDITTIFRRAEPAQLREQELVTLTRQIRAALDARFGNAPVDPKADGEDAAESPYIQEVLVAKCMEFASDY